MCPFLFRYCVKTSNLCKIYFPQSESQTCTTEVDKIHRIVVVKNLKLENESFTKRGRVEDVDDFHEEAVQFVCNQDGPKQGTKRD